MVEDANRPIKSLLTMHEIINMLDDLGQAGVVDVSDRLNRPQSVVHDYLSTLTQLGYVTKTGSEYKLSLRYLEIGSHVRDRIPLYEIGRPKIRSLAKKSNSESVTLCVEENGCCIALDVARSGESITYDWTPGTYFGMHCTGAGKAMLAYYPEERVESIIDQHGLPARTENTITDPETLYRELKEIRERGVSFERGEYKTRMHTIAAPITDADGKVLGALSVSSPAHRMRESDIEAELEDELLSTINIIEINHSAR